MKKSKNAETVCAIILTLIMTFMEMTVLPALLFCDIHFKDVEPIYFALMLNFILAFIICGIFRKTVLKDWIFGLRKEGIISGLKRYGLLALVATVAVAISFCIGLYPLDNSPTVWRVLIEGILYYVGVGIMEELYLRGLMQNILENAFGDRKNATLYAILITSVLFGAGHIFGAIGQPLFTIVCKALWATGLGVYLGAVYVKTRNLWVPIILHTIIDFCGIPVCFATNKGYPDIAVLVSLISFVLLGIYGIVILLHVRRQ
ncbi:MAG: CPBP family intramembrane metalloprotease [Butyrivibrio sp.]|nr:CPBP family intramembrane metalloprotease [Butyrivibrio sp.]